MSVIIRLQNLPWSANALDIRNYFRGLSIPEGGVHIVGGELGDAFIAFSTDEDARQAMMLDCGKIKEIQVKLLLSSRSEMHKVIEAARQTVPLLTLAPVPPVVTVPTPTPAVAPQVPPSPVIPAVITPFSPALGNNSLSTFGIPGLGNPQEVPQPAVIELPPTHVSPTGNSNFEDDKEEERIDVKRRRQEDRRRSPRSRSRSRERDRKERKRDRRDRSRSRERRRRDRSRSREGRRDRKRDRKERSRSRERSASRKSRDRRKSPGHSQEKESLNVEASQNSPINPFAPNPTKLPPQLHQMLQTNTLQNVPMPEGSPHFNDPTVADAMTKMQELAKKRNPNAFQGDHNGGKNQGMGRGGVSRGPNFQRERRSRFGNDEPVVMRDSCVAIRNAPNHTSYGDVRRFFPFIIDKHGIKMINDNMGRRTGNIFVKFIETRSKQLALQRKNNELKGARVLVEELDDDAYEAGVDSFLPYREDNDAEDAKLIIADIQERSKPSYTVLKLTEMPYFVKELDIIKAFNDFSLLSITLTECRITRSKIALVQFVKTEDARLAFERKDRICFGRRHPTMEPLSDEEFETEKNALIAKNDKKVMPPEEEPPPEMEAPRDPRQRRQQYDNGSVGGPPGLAPGPQGTPFFAHPSFSPGPNPNLPPGQNQNFPPGQNPSFPPGQNPSFPPGHNQGFPPGPGGQFPSPQFGGFPGPANIDPRTAASNWSGRPHFPSQMEHLSGPVKPQHQTPPTVLEDEPLDCVLMKGLPRDASDRTIVNFLSDTGAVPARIHLMLDGAGLPSGDCFCEFRSTQEARLAAGKHGDNLEGCRVTVDIVPRSVVEEALEGPKPTEHPMQENLIPSGPPQFFEPMARGGFNSRGSFRGRGVFDRGGFDRGMFDRGGFNSRGFDSGRGYRGRGGFNERGARGGFEGRGRGRGGIGRGMFENGRPATEEPDPALEDFGAPGCVVSMENVPFRATIDEIMLFFSEFELTQDDIIRRYNERGQPTGDARVAFRTPFDAQRAVKTRHMDTIHDRRISLNIL